MLIQAPAKKVKECPTCRGRGLIEVGMTELFIPEKIQRYSKAKMILAFIIGFLILSPALLGLYWEGILSKWGP